MPVLDRVRELATAARISLDDVAARSAPHAQASIAGLTPREEEILRHLVAGRTYAEIAGALFLSEKTVSSHISNMLRKRVAAYRVVLEQFARSGAGSCRPAGLVTVSVCRPAGIPPRRPPARTIFEDRMRARP